LNQILERTRKKDFIEISKNFARCRYENNWISK